MRNKRIATASAALTLAMTAIAFAATPASAAPNSPGACNMFHVGNSNVGFAGMGNSGNGEGYQNMLDLVEASGCLS